MVDKISDPFLNDFALGLLIFVVVAVFYGIIAIHDIPARIAKSRHHPHEDAIHAAGWVSLFMLHVLWPFLWIWAMAYKPERGWGFAKEHAAPPLSPGESELDELRRRISELENRAGNVPDDQSSRELRAKLRLADPPTP
jgi:hypothetical protein